MSIVKTVRKYGNSGGVYLPAGWVGGTVKIELVEQPFSPKSLLSQLPLEHVISAIVYGSYTRGEMAKESDIDLILVVDEMIKLPAIDRRYDVQIKTVEQMKSAMARDPIFHKSLQDSSVAIINHQFLDDLKEVKLEKDSIKLRIDMAESSLNLTKSIMDGYTSDELLYPVMMRLKEMIILDCLLSNRKYTTKMLRNEIIGSGISSRDLSAAMGVYRALRDSKSSKRSVPESVISRLILLLEMKIKHVRQKAREKGY